MSNVGVRLIQLEIDLFMERLIKEPFDKHTSFFQLLDQKNKFYIDYVNSIIKERGYEIFECLGTENIYTFLDNIEMYYKDKYYTLKYLYNYKDANENLVFKDTLKLLFGGNDNWHKNTFIFSDIWDNENVFDIIEFISITSDTEDFNTPYYNMHMNNLLFIYRDGYEVNIHHRKFRQTENKSLYDSLLNLILNLALIEQDKKNEKKKYHRDYIITIIYLATKYCFYELTTNMEEAVDLIINTRAVSLNYIYIFHYPGFYELFHIVFWYVLNGIIYYDDDNDPIQIDDCFDIYKSFTRMVEFGASLGRKFVVPPYLKSLKYISRDMSKEGGYGTKRRKYRILKIKEREDDLINPKKQILEIGIKLEDEIMEARILLQEIFGILFLKTENVFEITQGEKVEITQGENVEIIQGEKVEYYTFTPWYDQSEREREPCLRLFENINPRLEKMFINGTLDTTPFIKSVRLFNELYTILYIFPFIIESKKTPNIEWDLKKQFKMLIFTSIKERKIFEQMINNKKFKEEMTDKKLNSFKRWSNRKFSPIIVPEGAINWNEGIIIH